MLVAGSALGLIAPIGVQASDVLNLDGMNDYSKSNKSATRIDSKTFVSETNEEIAALKGRVDGLEAQQNNFEAGAFSSTTTMDGKAIMWIGAVDGHQIVTKRLNNTNFEASSDEQVNTGYTYTMNLNTSFTGDDNLYVRLKAGINGAAWSDYGTAYHIETKNTEDSFNVDKMWYTFPIGDNITAFAGPRIENYYMYVTPSIYQPGALKAFKLGGNSNFGASTDVGFGFKWETDSGFAIASNIVDKNADSTGLLGKANVSKWDTQIAYTQDRWHVSATLSDAQNWTSQKYNATALGKTKAADSTGYALRAYWSPEETGSATPEVSVGYDTKTWEYVGAGTTGDPKEADSYMVGLTWRDMFQADDRIGVALTQPLALTEVVGGGATGEVDPILWEAYYSFRPNDSMEITPAVFGGDDVTKAGEDIFGAVVTTTFKF